MGLWGKERELGERAEVGLRRDLIGGMRGWDGGTGTGVYKKDIGNDSNGRGSCNIYRV